jgi:hypothetical protein
MPRLHVLDDTDDALMRRWKGNGLGTYRVHIVDEEYALAFTDGQFQLQVESGIGAVPIFTDDDRVLLGMYLDELEAKGQAVRT